MFNLQHILYMVISGLLTTVFLILAGRYAKKETTQNFILKFSAILTVVIHYSNLWVNFFATGGSATIENNHILPVYPCNVVMWTLLICALLQNKKGILFQILGEFSFYAGIVGGVLGIVLNVNFDSNPTLANYDILKGFLSHSTMLFGCIYLLAGGFIRLQLFNTVSIAVGLVGMILCGLGINGLYTAFDMIPPDGMFLLSNPYVPFPPLVITLALVLLLWIILTLRDLRKPRQERWYTKLLKRN